MLLTILVENSFFFQLFFPLFQLTLSLSKSVLADNIIGRHACLHTEFIHGGDIPFPTEHKLSRLTTPPIEYMLNGYDESALNGVVCVQISIAFYEFGNGGD